MCIYTHKKQKLKNNKTYNFSNLCVNQIVRNGSEEQKEKYKMFNFLVFLKYF